MITISKVRPKVKKVTSLVVILTLLFSALFPGKVFAASSLIPDINLAHALSDMLGEPVDSITISDMQRISGDLNLEKKGIADLTGLQYAKNVTGLHLMDNNISDLTPIQSMTQLEVLDIDDNPVTDLKPLGNLVNLITLFLPGIATFTNWQVMSSLTKLQSLTATRNNINDLTFVQNMTNLQELLLSGCPITDATPLANLHNLRAVDLHGESDISDVTPLLSSTGITFLNISLTGNEQQQNEQLQKLATLTAMECLQISHTTLSDVSPLSSMTHLQSLILQAANVQDISPLAQCHNLSFLAIDGNLITDITPLSKLPLGILSVEQNFINVYSGANKAVIDKIPASPYSSFSPQRKLAFVDSQTVSLEIGQQKEELLGIYYTNDGSSLDSLFALVTSNDVTLQSSDNSIATVFVDAFNNICINANNSGTAQITAYYRGWHSDLTTATLNVKVNIPSVINGSISGQIIDAKTGNPIQGAMVDIGNGKTVKADATGHYSFSNLSLGNYTVDSSAIGYTSGSDSTTLKAGDTDKTVNIALSPLPTVTCSITGQITDASTGNPIQSAVVDIGGGKTVTADATGHYSFSNLAIGSYMVKATATGYTSGDSITNLTVADSVKIVNIALTPIRGRIFGQITDASTGNSIQGATVKIGGKTVTTDAVGDYLFVGLALGNYTVNVSATGYISGSDYTTITSLDKNKTVNISLSPIPVTGSISGQIIDSTTGSPVQGATVNIGSKTATTDATGRYSFTSLGLSSYTVNTSATGYKSESISTALTAVDKDRTVNIALTPITGTVSGRVTLSDGTPLSNVRIMIHSTPRFTYTDNNGYYFFPNVELGEHTVFISDESFMQQSENYSAIKVVVSANKNNDLVTTYGSENINSAAANLALDLKKTALQVNFIAIPQETPLPTSAQNPKTGEQSNPFIPDFCIVSIGIAVVLAFRKRRKEI